mgnify:FL=1
MSKVFYEPAFGLDSFRKPLVYEDWQVVAQSIIIVLFGRPGFYPSIPQLGVHIQDLMYEKIDDIDTDNLRGILAHQLEVFSDIIQSDDMKIAIKNTTGGNPVLIIALPIYTGDERSAVAVTITATEDGGIQYNYEKIDDSLLAKI